jgi:flagellar biosynthesis GTPase FlhF
VPPTDEPIALFDVWTRRGVLLALVPLLGWDAASVFMLALACHIPAYVAWIPAISTSGIMIASTRISMRATDPDVRHQAKILSWVGLALGVFIAAAQHALPQDLAAVHWAWLALIGALPVAMGGWLWHIYSLAHQRAEAAELAQRAEAITRAEVEATTQRARLAAAREQETQIEHARQLAAIAEQRASAEQAAADAAARKLAAERKLASEVATVAAGPRPVPGRKPETGSSRQAPLRKAAITELTRRHRAGQDITQTVSAELDRTIGASVGYTKKIISDLVAAVLKQEREVA